MFNTKVSTRSINIAIAVVLGLFVFATFKCASVECPVPSHITPALENPVKIIGTTKDGKYNVYDLNGELDDLSYMTSGNIVYSPNDLPVRLRVVAFEDVNNGEYTCGFVCKNRQGQIVGINPSWARTYGAKPPYDY